jgi:hypothetical protein
VGTTRVPFFRTKTNIMKQILLIIISWELAKLAIKAIFDKIVNE